MVSTPSLVALATLGALGNLASQAEANAFLVRSPPKMAMLPLLEELERIVGKDHRNSTESRATRVEETLGPTFQAMPKSSDGGIKPDAVRYMVHRYFVDRHGWFVDGLGSGGETLNNSSPATIFKGQEGDDVQDFFEVRFQKHSFSLHQVAVFVATLEGFVHAETLDRLNAVYRLLNISATAARTPETRDKLIIESYMMLYINSEKANYSDMTPATMRGLRKEISEIYPGWPATKKWLAGIIREVLTADDADAPVLNSFDFSVKVLEEVGDRYGRWQNSECIDLKHSLMKLETAGTGRVDVATFYESALQGNWQFSESVEYLRELGALDESDAQRPSVIIANYVNAPANCIASSKFYSLCCIDECESLVSHLETRIASPEAAPARIIDLVSSLPSPTVAAPRTLAASLLQRLDEIANHHHGTVPLHGRLFAQWMHHAYPRECSYPHLSGTLNSLTQTEWEQKTGQSATAQKATMMMHTDAATQMPRMEHHEESELPWTAEEELFVSRHQPVVQDNRNRPWLVGKGLAGSGAIFSVIYSVSRMFPAGKHGAFVCPSEKYFV